MRNNKNEHIELEVAFAGICGSDINRLKNDDNINTDCLGHEIVGKIHGEKDFFIVNPFYCSHECFSCKYKSLMYCKNSERIGNGVQLNGGFSGRVTVPRSSLYRIHCENPKVGVLVDSVAVVFHSLHMAKINKNDEILILGDGTLGVLYALVSAGIFKHSMVAMVVRSSEKFDILQEVFSGKVKLINEDELDENKKYDKIIEAVGGNQSLTLGTASKCVKNDGKIIVLGAFNEKFSCWPNIRSVFYKQVTVVGINSYCKKKKDFEHAKKYVCKNEKLISKLLTEEYIFKGKYDKNEWIKKCILDKKTFKGLIVYDE